MYQIAIVEDDHNSRNILKEYVLRYQSESGIQFRITEFSNGLNFVSDYSADFDVIFMDIDMPYMDGLRAAHELRQMDENVCLIFATNMAQYAIKGYEVQALDFIVKPVSYEIFVSKLEKAMRYQDRFRPKEIVISTSGGMRRVPVQDIYYIEVRNHTLIYHLKGGECSARGSVRSMERELAEYDFVRCSNSYLVNLRYVTEAYNTEILVKQDRIPVGPTKRKEFMRRLAEFMGEYIQ